LYTTQWMDCCDVMSFDELFNSDDVILMCTFYPRKIEVWIERSFWLAKITLRIHM